MEDATAGRIKRSDCSGVKGWPWRSRELLKEAFIDDGQEPKEIAQKWGCHPDTIRTWIRRHGLRGVDRENDNHP